MYQVDPWEGQLLDERFFLQQRLYTGGMSYVYLAKDNTLDQLVAIKILRQSKMRRTHGKSALHKRRIF